MGRENGGGNAYLLEDGVLGKLETYEDELSFMINGGIIILMRIN